MRLLVTETNRVENSAAFRRALSGRELVLTFGSKSVVVAEDGEAQRLSEQPGLQGTDSRVVPPSVELSRLHLVVQKGRTFQQEHPEVPVLFDRGRYLLVDVDPQTLRPGTHDSCFSIRPIANSEAVYRDSSPASPQSSRAEGWVNALVAGLDLARYRADVTRLASMFTRFSLSAEFRSAAAWAAGELTAMGYSTTCPTITVPGGTSLNVVAEKPGRGTGTRNLVLIFAHLDSVNVRGGVTANAPGADDNASGSAGVLAIARAFASHNATHDIRFILFGGEEQGLHGSRQYVAALSPAERARLVAAINMDMIGVRNTATPTVLLEGAAVSRAVMDGLAASAAEHTSLVIQRSESAAASDHVPFIDAGLPAVLTIEGADSANTAIHTAADVVSTLDFDLAAAILRMNIGFIATQLGQFGGIMTPIVNFPLDLGTIYPSILEWYRYSGKYSYNGGATGREASRGVADPMAAQDGVIYAEEIEQLDERDGPGLVTSPIAIPGLESPYVPIVQFRFTLHIDIDGSDPLNVVSGVVSRGYYFLFPPQRFIGRVTSNTASGTGRELVVEDFSVPFPGGRTCNRLEISLSGAPWNHTARVVFVLTDGTRNGPHTAPRESRFFREVEIEVDREENARDPEPYDTHLHPDRPAGLRRESLTIERAFAHAGIGITRSEGANVIASTAGGADQLWTEMEMHDAMEDHWSDFQNSPQWKLWVFIAERADDPGLGGVMFDGLIDEPGGVDRQGTAVFTECEHFHLPTGAYVQANPPVNEAARRELFFDVIHEMGHAFNLAHSYQKFAGRPWNAPSWMPVVQNTQALSWMNYPEVATESGAPASAQYAAKWFYDRFRFRFDANELLFLRHAPERFVQMGNEPWAINHGRASRSEISPDVQMEIRTLKPVFELGEAVQVEVKISNRGQRPVEIPHHLHAGDGLLEIGITRPDGTKRPAIPFAHPRHLLKIRTLKPGESVYHQVDLTIGKFGMPFKHDGAYLIECVFRYGGRAAAANHRIFVRPAPYEFLPAITEIFNARVGRVLAMGGTRTMREELDKISWVLNRIGTDHPAAVALARAKAGAFATPFKLFDSANRRIRVEDKQPDVVVETLRPIVHRPEFAADTLGHVGYANLVRTYTAAAVDAGRKEAAREVQKEMKEMFRKRNVAEYAMNGSELQLAEVS